MGSYILGTIFADMKQPCISIVTPSFNQAAYLEQTICAILEQDYSNLEYIIIDGGSTDCSIDIIRRYARHLTFWVSEPDEGQSEAINKGFARCTGDIITFCNSDDYYLPGTLANVATAFTQFLECGAIIGGFYYVNGSGQRMSEARPPHLAVATPYDLTLGPPGVYRLHQAATFFTRSALDAVGRSVRTDLQYVMDRDLLYRVARRFPIVTRQQTYAAFRLHSDSKSVSHVLPFYEEFGRLYMESMTGDDDADQKRKAMARHYAAKGYLKLGTASGTRMERARMLLEALRYAPRLIASKSYYARWRKALLPA